MKRQRNISKAMKSQLSDAEKLVQIINTLISKLRSLYEASVFVGLALVERSHVVHVSNCLGQP